MKRLSKTIMTALFLVIFSGAAFGASFGLDVDSLYFNADEKADVMGAGTSRSADGRADACFSLGVSGAQAITEISLRNETTGRMWSTSPSNSVPLLLVKNSGGNILNSSGSLPITPVLMGADFRLYINDAEGSIPTDSDFTVIVRLIDNREITGKTRVNGLGYTYPYANSAEGVSAFEINGIDGNNNRHFTLALNFNNVNVRAMKVSAQNYSENTMWDTVEGNNVPTVTVIDNGNNIMNRRDGTVDFAVRGTQRYTLLVRDKDGILEGRSAKAKIVISLADGRTFERETSISNTTALGEMLSVEFKGSGRYDFTGQDEKMESNGHADKQIDAVIQTSGTVAGVRVRSASSGWVWDTIPGNGKYLVVVTDDNNRRQNNSDGSINMAVNGTKSLSLWFDGDKTNKDGPYTVTFIMSDGRTFEREASINNTTALRETLAVEFKGTGRYDFTGQDEKMESNGHADKQIDAVIQTSGTVAGVRVRSASSGWVWDTIPGNGKYLVVVTDDNNRRQNRADGSINMAVNGTKSLSLWFDGDNTKKDGPYTVTFVMSDGQVLEASTGDTPAAPATKVTKADRSVVFTSARPALANLDHVGKNKKRAANGYKDTALNIKITGKGNVKSLLITEDNSGWGWDGKGWDTLAENNGRWLLGVREGNKMLNHNNGTVNIPVNGTKTYQLLMQDNGNLRKRNGVVHVSVTWADGEVTQSYLKW